MDYSPFKKDLRDITEKELQQLIADEVSEGWYVEFKRDFPKSQGGNLDKVKILKSVAGFANTNGGWLIYGIKAENQNAASEICGIDLSNYNNISDQLSQIIASNINPKPFYHFKSIKLENGNYVIIIKVEEGSTPPYITSDGLIYQRENSENKPIKDRYVLERLNDKTDRYFSGIEDFCKINYGETQGQSNSNQTFLEIFLFPLPNNNFSFQDFYSSEFFKKTALEFYQTKSFVFEFPSEKAEVDLNLGFNSIYSSEKSLIIRPMNEKNMIYKSETVELFYNGNVKIVIPISEFSINDVPERYSKSKVIDYLLDRHSPMEKKYVTTGLPHMRHSGKEVTQRSITDFVSHIRLVDGFNILLSVLILMDKYRSMLEYGNYDFSNEIGFRVRITNTWRKMIFFDGDDYLERLKLYNLPISPKNDVECPRFYKGNFYRLDFSEQYSFITIAKFILESIGLPDPTSLHYFDLIKDNLQNYKSVKWNNL